MLTRLLFQLNLQKNKKQETLKRYFIKRFKVFCLFVYEVYLLVLLRVTMKLTVLETSSALQVPHLH